MPSPNSLWLVTAPSDSAVDEQLADLNQILHGSQQSKSVKESSNSLGTAQSLQFPTFKTGTLSSLLTLSESLAKTDPTITSTLAKITDTIKSLVSVSTQQNVPTIQARVSPLETHLVMDDGRPYQDYVISNENPWEWNRAKYRTDVRTLTEVVDTLVKEAQAIENTQRVKTQTYTTVKSQLALASRKKTGNLSVRSMAEVVSVDDFSGTTESEYLETVLVAVPRNLTKEWETSYERLTSMVVPRSSKKLATDDEFTLFGVAIFRKVKDEFAQKCRENKFIIRDFTYNEEAIEKQKADLVALEAEEKELWTDLLRLSRINFSECFSVTVHLKIVRAFVESVLRYGLPATYFLVVIKPAPKAGARLLSALSAHFTTLSPSARKVKKIDKNGEEEAPIGEFANVLEGEFLDFVLFEIEKVD